jgi:hypothetical protein
MGGVIAIPSDSSIVRFESNLWAARPPSGSLTLATFPARGKDEVLGSNVRIDLLVTHLFSAPIAV